MAQVSCSVLASEWSSVMKIFQEIVFCFFKDVVWALFGKENINH